MNGRTSNTIPELLEKIHHLRHRANTEDRARKKLELLRQVLTTTIVGEISAQGAAEPPNDPIL